MALYKLAPTDENNDHWEPWFDCCFGMVVRAATEQEARLVAQTQAGDEQLKGTPWLDAALTRCERLDPDGAPEVILRDVHWA